MSVAKFMVDNMVLNRARRFMFVFRKNEHELSERLQQLHLHFSPIPIISFDAPRRPSSNKSSSTDAGSSGGGGIKRRRAASGDGDSVATEGKDANDDDDDDDNNNNDDDDDEFQGGAGGGVGVRGPTGEAPPDAAEISGRILQEIKSKVHCYDFVLEQVQFDFGEREDLG